MANIDKVNGATPVKHLNGSSWNGAANLYAVPAADPTALFVGDFVKIYGTADATTGLNSVIQAAAGDRLCGVVVGFVPDPTQLELVYRKASTLRYAWVADSPDTIFEIQEDGEGATLALIDIGENADITVAAGNTTTGASGMELDSSSHQSATAQLRILKFVQREDNTPVSQWAKVEVLINEHEYNQPVGT